MDREGRKTDATEMRHYIVIQSKASTTDGEGGFSENWSDVEMVAAAIYPIRAQQQFNFRSVNVDATHFIKIRGKITISEDNRIKFESGELTRYFEILTIENTQERDFIKFITCKERRS